MSKHRPVIVDECCTPRIAKYLEEMGEEVIYIQDGRPDDSILHLAMLTEAYIITRDKGFRTYQRSLVICRKEKPSWVYGQLQRMKAGERH